MNAGLSTSSAQSLHKSQSQSETLHQFLEKLGCAVQALAQVAALRQQQALLRTHVQGEVALASSECTHQLESAQYKLRQKALLMQGEAQGESLTINKLQAYISQVSITTCHFLQHCWHQLHDSCCLWQLFRLLDLEIIMVVNLVHDVLDALVKDEPFNSSMWVHSLECASRHRMCPTRLCKDVIALNQSHKLHAMTITTKQ